MSSVAPLGYTELPVRSHKLMWTVGSWPGDLGSSAVHAKSQEVPRGPCLVAEAPKSAHCLVSHEICEWPKTIVPCQLQQ